MQWNVIDPRLNLDQDGHHGPEVVHCQAGLVEKGSIIAQQGLKAPGKSLCHNGIRREHASIVTQQGLMAPQGPL